MASILGDIGSVDSVLVSRVAAIDVPQIVVTSGFRPGDLLSHGDGDALDLMCEDSRLRYRILASLLDSSHGVPIARIGIGPRHIHVDVSKRLPQAVFFFTEGFEDVSS